MCDYSLHNVKTRPAKVGDKLTTRKFQILAHEASPAPEDIERCSMPTSGDGAVLHPRS